MGRAEVITLTNGAFAENCYLVTDRDSGEVALVDPGEDAELFLRRIRTEELQLRAVWLTHAHVDHVLGVARVVEATGAPVYLHPADRPLYDHIPEQGQWFGLHPRPAPAPDHELVDGASVSLGGLQFEVRHVPGHSPGSVAFVGHGLAIVGDVLFAGSIGRTDLPGGDGPTLIRSIQARLLTLPDETMVYPGHGPVTTIGEERRHNPFLTGALRLV